MSTGLRLVITSGMSAAVELVRITDGLGRLLDLEPLIGERGMDEIQGAWARARAEVEAAHAESFGDAPLVNDVRLASEVKVAAFGRYGRWTIPTIVQHPAGLHLDELVIVWGEPQATRWAWGGAS